MRTESRLVSFDLFRGLSALAVCAGHTRAALFVDYASLAGGGSLAAKGFYALTGLGHQAVMVFFVLSGYFVGGSVLHQGASFRWHRYLLARLTRLWIVVLPTLLWTAIADAALARTAPEVLAGAHFAHWSSGPIAGTYSATPLTLIANVFFLQTIAAPVFGSNGPMWSLANEACYYLLFPMLAFACGHGPQASRLKRALFAALAIGLFSWMSHDLQLGFAVWLLGVAIAFAAPRLPRAHPAGLAAGCATFGLALVYSKSVGLQTRLALPVDLVVGIGFSLLALAALCARRENGSHTILARFATGLSEISYSLYLFHFPLVLLIAIHFYGDEQLQPSLANMTALPGWVLVLLLCATAFWWLFERRTSEVRAWLEARLQSVPIAKR